MCLRGGVDRERQPSTAQQKLNRKLCSGLSQRSRGRGLRGYVAECSTPPSRLKALTIMAKPGRNDPCHCGSGKKYKKCCQPKEEAAEREVIAKDQAAREERTEARRA